MKPVPYPRGGARLALWVALCCSGLALAEEKKAAEALRPPGAVAPSAAPEKAPAEPKLVAPLGTATDKAPAKIATQALPTQGASPATVAPEASAAAPVAVAPAAAVSGAPALGRDTSVEDLSSPTWNEAQGADDLGYGWVLLRTLVVLGLVLGLIYLTLNVGLRRLMGIKGVPAGRTSVVTLLERVPLDQKRALFVVRAAGEYLLLGGGDGGIALVSKLDPAEVERLQREKPPAPLALSPFLQKLLTRRGGTPPPTA